MQQIPGNEMEEPRYIATKSTKNDTDAMTSLQRYGIRRIDWARRRTGARPNRTESKQSH